MIAPPTDLAAYRAELHAWLRAPRRRAGAQVRAARHARRAGRADAAREVGCSSMPGWMQLRVARARRWPGRPTHVPHRAGCDARGARGLVESRSLLADRGARPHAHRVRASRRSPPTWCRACCRAPSSGARGSPSRDSGSDLASLRCRAVPRRGRRERTRLDLGDQRPEGLDRAWPSSRERCVLLTRTGSTRVPPPRASRPSSSTWTRRGSRVAADPDAMHGEPRVRRGLLRRRPVVPAGRMLGELNGGWADRDEHPARTSARRASGSASRTCTDHLQRLVEVGADRRSRGPASSATPTWSSTHSARARAATQYRLAETGTLGAETSIDKVLDRDRGAGSLRRRPPTSFPGPSSWTTARRGRALARTTTCTRGRPASTAGTAEVQRNIIARRLLDLGSDE